MATTSESFAAVRRRIDSASYPYPVYYNGDNTPLLPDTPTSFAFVVFNNEGSSLVAYGGGRGLNTYRNRGRVEAYVFSPFGIGMEAVADAAELIATQLRSFRDNDISCFDADVIPIGQGASLAVPGLVSEVSNYQCAIVEAILTFDQIG